MEIQRKLRISYSLLSQWEKGDIGGAINVFKYENFGIETDGTPAMMEGKRYHDEISKHIETYNCLPDYMGTNLTFTVPKTEHLVTVPYNEICDLGGRFDCLEEPILYEWKTGVSDSLEWARTWQLPIYFLICELAGINVDLAYLVRYNQYEKKSDYCIVHNTKKKRDDARNRIDSLAPEIVEYFQNEGLI